MFINIVSASMSSSTNEVFAKYVVSLVQCLISIYYR